VLYFKSFLIWNAGIDDAMRKCFEIGLGLLMVVAVFAPRAVSAAQVLGPDVKIKNGNILASASLVLESQQMDEISKGVSKEIIFYVDLFRVWKSWPDEFVLGQSFVRTLSCDPVKKEFKATSLSGSRLVEKRFSSCEGLMGWALVLPEVSLTNTGELEPGEYFVKVTVESRLRRLPPFINLLFFFVKEKEFTVTGESPLFPLKLER